MTDNDLVRSSLPADHAGLEHHGLKSIDAKWTFPEAKPGTDMTLSLAVAQRTCPSHSNGWNPQRDVPRRNLRCPLHVSAGRMRRFPVGASPTLQPLQREETGAVMDLHLARPIAVTLDGLLAFAAFVAFATQRVDDLPNMEQVSPPSRRTDHGPQSLAPQVRRSDIDTLHATTEMPIASFQAAGR